MDDAETYMQYVTPVCVRTRTDRQMIPKIDTGIAQKGHLWMGTGYY